MKLNLVKNYKTYDRYKDSGVEWLGEIPENFKLWKIYQMFEVGRGRVISKEELLDDGKYPIYSSQTKNQGIFGYINTYDFNGNYLTWTTDGANAGSVFRRKGQFNCTNVCGTLKLRNNNKFSINFLRYSLLLETKRFVRDDLNPKLMSNVISKIRVLVPDDIQTQQKIAGYLDEKTETIDKIIKRKKKLIELLEEKRKNTIKDCIKKTNSEKIKLSYLTRIERGRFNHRPRNDPSFYNGIYPFIQTGDIVKSKTKIKKYSQTLNELGKSVSKKFPKGTLLMSIAANIGDVAILDFDAYLPDSIVGFLPSKKIKPKFLFYQFNIMKEDFLSLAVENTQLNLNIERMGIIKITCPSLVKQQEIIDYLDKKTEDIDKTIKKINQSINLLTEYKSSLISNVVTGKAKV
jgi:type I restriction enzyme S subunit